jgi:hypothetical protein
LEKIIEKPCFDPNSSICSGCIMTDNMEETILFHLAHLEQDHHIHISEVDGVLKMDQQEYIEKGGLHHLGFC